jgi:thiol-disulfide isomerase/thioredoxin
MKKTILILVMAALCLISRAQNTAITPLKPGEKVPAYLWNAQLTTLNGQGKETKITLKQYQGKLLILDFWATWCSSCIAGFAKLEKLQTHFSEDIKILLITDEPASKVSPFLEKRKNRGQTLKLETVISDSLLKSTFPHHLIPHYVWIDSSGTVISTTASGEVNEKTITAMLTGNQSGIREKQDIDAKRPLFSLPALPEENLEYYSLLLKGHYPGLGTGVSYRYKNDTLCGVALTNSSLRYIYQIAAKALLPDYPDKRTITGDPGKGELPEKNKNPELNQTRGQKNEEMYSYELRLPPGQSGRLYPQMLSQLNQLSPLHGQVTQKSIQCLTLVKTKALLQKSHSETRLNELDENGRLTLRGSPMLALAGRLNNAFKALILDETGIRFNIDLELSIYPGDLEATNEQLAKHGLMLKPAKRKTKVLLLSADQKLTK